MFLYRTFRLFYFRGVPVEISLLGLLFIGLYILPSATGGGAGLTTGVVLGVGVMLSILIHELAHAASGMAMGASVIGIQLNLLGGVTYFAAKPASYFKDILVSLAGPASNLLLWKLCEFLPQLMMKNSSDPQTLAIGLALQSLAHLNLFLGIFNALPAYPLDGGQAAYMLIRWITADEKFAAGVLLTLALALTGFIFFGQTGVVGNFALPIGGIFALYICAWVLINTFNLYNQATSFVKWRPTPRQQYEKMRQEAEKKNKTHKGFAAFEQGKALLLEKDYAQAVARFNEALELEPKMVDYLDYRAYTYCQMGDLEKALTDYDVLLEKLPKRADYYACRAGLYKRLNQMEAARTDAEKALRLNPLDTQARSLHEELSRT